MNNIFPLDQDNVWNVYGSTPPPNVSLQSPSSLPNSLNIGNQLNLRQISNGDSLRSNMFQSPLYPPETSPENTPLTPQRDVTPRGSRSRYDKDHIFDFTIRHHTEQNMDNRKSWNDAMNFAQMKSPLDVNSPDLSPANNGNFMNMSGDNMLDDFGKSLMDNVMVDPSTGQLLPIRCPDVNKYDMLAKSHQQIQQEQLPQRSQFRQQQQQQQQIQQDSRYVYTSNKQMQMAAHQQQQQQKQQQNFQQTQQQQQPQHQQQPQQQSSQQQSSRQQRQRQQQGQSSKIASKKQQLQKDKHQKSNIKSVFSNITGKDAKKSEESDSRYNNTLDALKQAGLLDITMQTGDLLKKSNSLQKDIDMLEEIVKVTKHLMTSEET